MDLVKINPQEFGLTDDTAKGIQMQFQPMLEKMVQLENEYNNIINLEIDNETIKKAKELRLKYVKVRTATAEIHKIQKAFYLNGGRFVDGWKNAQLFASQGKEEVLSNIEKYYENLEKERLAKLQEERIELIKEYVSDYHNLELSKMPDDVFNAYYNAKKQEYYDKKEAEKQAGLDRLEHEENERLERERIRLENEKLRIEAIEKQKQFEDELLKAEAERIAIENELKAKKEAEILAENNRLLQIEKQRKEKEELAKQPVKQQLITWVSTFELPEISIDATHRNNIERLFNEFKQLCYTYIERV